MRYSAGTEESAAEDVPEAESDADVDSVFVTEEVLVEVVVAEEVALSNAALYILCVPSTTTPDTTQITIAAIARPLPLFLPFEIPTMPTIPKIMPRIARKNEKLLMIGKNEVSSAMMPKTKPAIAIPDFDCGIGGIC